MSLKEADIRSTYFLNETSPYFFYNELYLHATEITIALGYFTKTAFCIGTDALLHFIKEKVGHIHLICNEKMLIEDAEAISLGIELKEKETITMVDFENLIKTKDLDDNQVFSYKCLAYLIAIGRLDIQVAKSDRLVHFKTGFATDEEGNIVAFSGSVNYTLSALLFNWEQLTTYCSWVNPEIFGPRIDELMNPIKELLSGKIEQLPLVKGKDIEAFIRVNYDPHDIAELEKDSVLAKKKYKIHLGKKKIRPLDENENSNIFAAPSGYSPRKHQVPALENYEKNDFKSLFAMATGTGKTLTSLFAVNDLNYVRPIQSVLILVPLQDLIKQWEKDVIKFYHGQIIKIGSEFSNWKESVIDYGVARKVDPGRKVVYISTYDSYLLNSDLILKSLNQANTVLIADEVHTFGAKGKQKVMPSSIPYRIGLSATPKRAYDDAGTKAVFDFFCPSNNPYVFSLEDAIHAGFLCKYNYWPVLVKLTIDEYEKYEELTEKIKRLSSHHDSEDDEESIEAITLLAKQRHRIIENAENKLDAVSNYFESRIEQEDMSKTIVFCPEGNNDDDDSNLEIIQRQIWTIIKSHKKTLKLGRYVQGTSSVVLKNFESGALDIIFAKKRLNEGIDIPSTQRAIFISSSTSEREFIQRRGRVLRTKDGKSIAEIVDFLVVPPDSSSACGSLLGKEFERFIDFAKTAKNKDDALAILSDYI